MTLIFFFQVSTYKESLYIGNIFLFFENYKSEIIEGRASQIHKTSPCPRTRVLKAVDTSKFQLPWISGDGALWSAVSFQRNLGKGTPSYMRELLRYIYIYHSKNSHPSKLKGQWLVLLGKTSGLQACLISSGKTENVSMKGEGWKWGWPQMPHDSLIVPVCLMHGR